MAPLELTAAQARRFVLRWQGLAGPRRFAGARGVVEYVRQAGCVQFDPVDVCGKNAEIVLFSRVAGFRKATLARLLYKDRALLDYWDKNMSILPVEDWPAFARGRARFRGWSYADESRRAVDGAAPQVLALLREKGVLCSSDLELNDKIDWPWAPTKLSRAVLEKLYFQGDSVIHHRQGAMRHYAPAENHLPAALLAAPDPTPDEADYQAWHTLRRIAAVGLLWNRPSAAWLCIPEYKGPQRAAAFARLTEEGALIECAVEGVARPLYAPAAARPVLEEVLAGARYAPRCEFIAPLDGLMWDRPLVKALFGFDYTWEIYTPAAKRRYGHYVLPVLDGEAFAGRIELRAERKAGTLAVHHYWPEEGARPRRGFATRLQRQLERFAAFNGCEAVVWREAGG